jgi:KAP family P-loop domain
VAGKKILLDAPTGQPALGYEGIAEAFAEIITDSRPNFAIGIFGGWGSGKTTLMSAIKAALPAGGILTVDFNAWRFEREPQLLVPLLDTLRGALAERAALAEESAAAGGKAPNAAPRLRGIAARVGRVVKALATGLSGSVGVPGAVTVKYDVSTAITALDALTAAAPGRDAAEAGDIAPKSLYVAAFGELQAAFKDLPDAGVTRVVIFVDDLDRCLPASALEVLESMKLFFDLPGFIFVVGLDEGAIDRALAAKLTTPMAGPPAIGGDGPSAAAAAPRGQLGREYAKKIFQVPYTLPAVLPTQLDDLLGSMYAEAGITGDQLADLTAHVRPYLGRIAVQRRVNPREVKRFINSYTLQTLIRPELEPEAILALQTIAFRPDWQPWYEAVSAHPNTFRIAVKKYRGEMNEINSPGRLLSGEGPSTSSEKKLRRDRAEDEFRRISRTDLAFSDEIREFLTSSLMGSLAGQRDLDPYLSSLQSIRVPPTGPDMPLLARACGFTEDGAACGTTMSFAARPSSMPNCPNQRGLSAHLFVW